MARNNFQFNDGKVINEDITKLEGFNMAIPAYLWLKDDGGADIKGAVDVLGREQSIEVLSFGHGMYLPTDNMKGKITGTRVHAPMHLLSERWQPFNFGLSWDWFFPCILGLGNKSEQSN